MKIAFKCSKCKQTYMGDEDDMCLEIDFDAQTLSYICHNKECHHENIIEFKSWQKKQLHSPLPRIGIL